MKPVLLAAGAVLLACQANAVLFDFDSATLHAPFPIDLTVDGVTAHLSAGIYNYSIQRADTLGFTPGGFGGYCVYPNTIYKEDLHVSFSVLIDSFSIMYAPEEYGCDSSATMRVTAYMGATPVGTATATAPQPGTWPTGVLSIANVQPFDSVIVHYESPPPTGGDWGPIFLADNMNVNPVPEPTSLLALLFGSLAIVGWHRRRR